MRLISLSLAAALAMPFGASTAAAEGFSVRDLLETADRADCLRRGERALQNIAKNGGGQVDVTDWIIYGWDIGPGASDVGGSSAMNASTCIRWVTTMSR